MTPRLVRALLLSSALPCLAVSPAAAHAAMAVGAPESTARFAIIVGVNDSIDKDAPPLRYADDDAAAYLNLFRALGAKTYLLSHFDDNTRRLHPQAAAEAHDPRIRSLTEVVEQVAADVAQSRKRHVPAVLYFIYAGHGNVSDGRGYLALEDGRLYGGDIEHLVLDRVKADHSHMIVDACYSVFLALTRGPGGTREEAHGFSKLGGLGARSDVGLLLSTSSARESHEWSEYQAGIFSHEVRSGMLGAADADRDGQVTYHEIAAFIDRANAPVPNERFRPDVYVKEPSMTPALIDIRPGLQHRIEMSGDHPGHYLIEDARGVRLVDFHNAPGQSLNLIREPSAGPLFLRLVGKPDEYVVDAAPDVLRFLDLHRQHSSTQPRGAAHESFSLLFSVPFSQQVVDLFIEKRRLPVAPPALRPRSWRPVIGVGLLGAGVAAAIAGSWAVVSADHLQQKPVSNQAEAFAANQGIDRRNTWARLLYGTGAAAIGAGALILFWPSTGNGEPPPVAIAHMAGGASVSINGRF